MPKFYKFVLGIITLVFICIEFSELNYYSVYSSNLNNTVLRVLRDRSRDVNEITEVFMQFQKKDNNFEIKELNTALR